MRWVISARSAPSLVTVSKPWRITCSQIANRIPVTRVKCSNCQEMGHYKSKCPNPLVDEDAAGGFNTQGFGNAGDNAALDNGGFGNGGGWEVAAGGGW